MESFENKPENLPGSQQKINEYAERIRNGEDAGKVMEGLGSFMRDAIEKKLLQKENSQNIEIGEEDLKIQIRLEDEKKIEEIRGRLGLSEKEKPNFEGDEQLEGIYNTMQNIAGGAKEGLQEDVERKIQKYIDEIGSGKNKEYVLQGLPEKWKSIVEERLEEKNINYELLKPEEVLVKLAEYCEPYMGAPLEAVQDGTFAGLAKLKIEAGSVVLIRHAADEDHLIKKGKPASAQEMADSSQFSGGAHEAGAVHTSADIDNWTKLYDRYPIYGEFRIPVKDFLNLGKEGKIIIGNLGEAEIVLSGDVAKKYLTKIVDKNKN